jgi:hypothetical protein
MHKSKKYDQEGTVYHCIFVGHRLFGRALASFLMSGKGCQLFKDLPLVINIMDAERFN